MNSGTTGDAYILLDVGERESDTIARLLSSSVSVCCAAAVWGPWDVIARVHTNSFDNLLIFIDELRNGDSRIRRTETWSIRSDQRQYALPGLPDRLAFVMLRVSSQARVENALNYVAGFSESKEGAQVWHAAGVLGSYDIATMVGYEDDLALTTLVMEHLQGRSGITDTLTIPTIAGMVYPESSGKPRNGRLTMQAIVLPLANLPHVSFI
jgi:uncharacterized protein with GYD domain